MTYVWHKVKGKWTTRFKTQKGALRVARKKHGKRRKYATYNLGGGRGWHIMY